MEIKRKEEVTAPKRRKQKKKIDVSVTTEKG